MEEVILISLGEKMVEVMQACRYMFKDAENPNAGYKYVSASTMFAKINEELTKRGLYTQADLRLESLIEVTTSSGEHEKLATVSAHVTITDVKTGANVQFGAPASGQDAGDKAVMKANTAALKYAYIGGLCIAMSDDPEADTNTAAYTKPATKTPNPAGMNKVETSCYKCAEPIGARTAEYSTKFFGRPLCYKCQEQERNKTNSVG